MFAAALADMTRVLMLYIGLSYSLSTPTSHIAHYLLLLVLLNLFNHVLRYLLDTGQVNCVGIALLCFPLVVSRSGNCRLHTLSI